MVAGHALCMSIAEALLVPGAMASLVALLVLGSWLEVRLMKAERQLKLVPAEVAPEGQRRRAPRIVRPSA